MDDGWMTLLAMSAGALALGGGAARLWGAARRRLTAWAAAALDGARRFRR